MLPKIIISLTTSPKRIYLLEKTLLSIINQNIKPDQIYVNIPPIFKRTCESYPDPLLIFTHQELFKDIIWNKECEDNGPITKLSGVFNLINEKEDTWIITIDDDIKYLQYTIELYMNCITKMDCKNAYGLSGFKWINEKMVSIYENEIANVIEGYGSCCYHRSFFPNRPWNNYLKKIIEDKNCRFSDDLIISNWLALNFIKRYVISTPYINRKLMCKNKCILDYGTTKDALHNGGELSLQNNKLRYFEAKQYLRSLFLLSKEFEYFEYPFILEKT